MQVLFESRAKLFRFTNGEFKERGIGDFKILKDKAKDEYRCLMRREVIHKICANFSLSQRSPSSYL